MPKRNVALYIDDILDSIRAIQSFNCHLKVLPKTEKPTAQPFVSTLSSVRLLLP